MASAKTKEGSVNGCTSARPKYGKSVKYPRIGRRTKDQIRVDFMLPNLDAEVVLSDISDQINIATEHSFDYEDALVAQIDGSGDNEEEDLELRERRLEFLRWAVSQLTERQAIALGLRFNGASQYEGAAAMNIKQPTFYETIYGKDGKGGAIKKLQKLATKYPITLS